MEDYSTQTDAEIVPVVSTSRITYRMIRTDKGLSTLPPQPHAKNLL